jgi:microcystin-dependent protein
VKQQPFHLERVGVTENYKGGTVPYGFLLEDGSNVSRTTFAKLFAKTGTTWGVGDGATTFGLPDSRRRASVGSGGTGTGTLGNAVGNVGGAETHALIASEGPAHNHIDGFSSSGVTGEYGNVAGANVANYSFSGLQTVHALTSTTGSGTAHNNLQPSMVVTKMIRWLGDI